MVRQINQGQIISVLNAYLEWNNMPFHMDEEGICNALALIYGKAILENKQDSYLEFLDYLSGKKSTWGMSEHTNDSINKLVIEILTSFMPELFHPGLNQITAMQALYIENNSLKSVFDFALTASDKVWIDIIKAIDLQEKEFIKVMSVNHAICVHKKNDKYVVYDPNYEEGPKIFATDKELIEELHHNVFHYNTDAMGLMINLVPHPDSPSRSLPKVTDLYDQYITADKINQEAKVDSITSNTLKLAALFGDDVTINYLLEKGANDSKYGALINAEPH